MIFQPGDLIFNGRYRVEGLAGQGAFGQAYHVTHLRLDAPRAIKVLRRDTPGVGRTIFQTAFCQPLTCFPSAAWLSEARPGNYYKAVYDSHIRGDGPEVPTWLDGNGIFAIRRRRHV